MFYECFENVEDLKREYEISDEDLQGVEFLYAAYRVGSYEGDSIVLFKKDGKLFIVESAHCSCYGLEGQWDPIEVTEASLKKEIEAKTNYRYEEFESFIKFCKEYFSW